jgi:hypothetical protein
LNIECPLSGFDKNLFHGNISSEKRNFEKMLFKKKRSINLLLPRNSLETGH